ncbi:homoserine O-acetyltransferase MetX [Pseudoroseomonas ludipueritiae]|uniref:Homoserine O-acetyltransferase n=1 Tax=Pseudoroseomonas ludipueritiae TaxID=198093 RepID=A0ABR7RAC4_9PROT|nr:homoserine O-acetyltransferase [Pseudoroseomonas ludipueritiae]MBC9178777.1 homoserine O-acetyltransferase [Pseudoroseomonas ludipueritiae]MCG7363346.1 homoserine O-acetyltransferase [Roseomonas sp. ACRSG]
MTQSPASQTVESAAAPVQHQAVTFPDGLALDCGAVIAPVTVAYRTYGRLDATRGNAVLICHALTGDQYVAEPHPITGKPGWWEAVVGPGKPVDTDRFFVICANVLGGCMGSTGPREMMTDAGGQTRPWGTDFPSITIRDMVRAQKLLVDHLGISRLLAVIGGSMGGMQVLEWAATFPEMVFAAAPIATATHHSAQNIAFHEVGRAAIHSDPDWKGGRYWEDGRIPARGLSVARMVAHITYLSESALARKFGRRLRGASALTFLEDVFEVESYLRHQGSTFVRRFDANSYLTITRAMDYFDLAAEHGGNLAAAFQGTGTRFFVASFDSDWLFPTAESRTLVRALNAAAANVSFVEIASDKGHDAFLLDEPEFHAAMGGFLRGAAERAGLRTA